MLSECVQQNGGASTHRSRHKSYCLNSRLKFTMLCPLFIIITIICFLFDLVQLPGASAFNHSERIQLRSEAKQMFYHAYHSYINTYPADEILPISCRGRFRQADDSSDIDDSIGNFSLTLVDSLDMLVMMGDIDEFQVSIKKIIKDLNFNMDITVSVFETNIRMLGGLLSAHVLAKAVQNPRDKSIRYLNETVRNQMSWYNSELLDLAEDLGRRLLPAFDTKTGIPHSRVNLKHGLESNDLRSALETCTACAGSLILEFATLSRLTGDGIFEEKARGALDALWKHRHRSTDLVGTVINIDTGDWVRRESGVGAGSDSYYEYLLKAYILLGDPTYLHRFNRHYSSVMRYISRGPFLIDVHMHRPNRIAKGFMDALSAFWPGLQVLKGDLKAAISTHAMFNEVIRRHTYLPEAFTTDLQVYWANHQMRPEFLESTFFLHRATREDYYLDTGKEILRKLQDLKVGCGFAGLKDVRTGVHDDKMASFVLAETLKYLYLLFSEDNETHVDLDKFIFSTEGHLLPIDLALIGPSPKDTTQGLVLDVDKSSKQKNTKRDTGPTDKLVKLVPWHEKDSEDQTKVRKEALIRLDKKTGQFSLAHSTKQQIPAAVAKLLMKMSDNFNQEKAVINLNDYENSCPSLEVQEMRFDGNYHPFLNKRIKPPTTTTSLTELYFAIGIKVFYSMSH
uniref:alpha-1,2-Mannosidase n=2 Tax=Aceria tosichella TaxID=561515 RepID=A0A6G1SF64_9ACAR